MSNAPHPRPNPKENMLSPAMHVKRSVAIAKKHKSDLDTCRADLEKTREDKNDIAAERDRLKAELTTANERFEKSEETNAKLGLQLQMQEDKCKEYMAEIEKLKQDSANSLKLKADLDMAKVSIGELTIQLNAKSAECKNLSELYKKSLTSRPRNVQKTFTNFPGPSSVMTAANRNPVDLNATIDLTTNDSDDENPSSSKKRKRY